MVVVANRLPVDQVTDPDGSTRWQRSPGGLVTALEPFVAGRGRRLGGLVGLGRRGPGAVRVRRHVADPGAADRGRGRPLLRGHVQRLAVAALPRRRREAGVPPALVGHLRAGQQALRRARRGGRRRGRDRLGARLPAAAGPGAAAPAAARPDDRLLPAHPLPALRAVHPAALAVGDRRGAARRRPGRLPAPGRGVQLRPARPPAARAARPRPAVVEYDGRTVAARAFPISIDVAAFDELARSPEVLARAEEIRKELGDPSKIILGVDRLDYTKGIGVRLAAFEELLEDGAVEAPDTVLVQVATPSRERVEHYVHMRETIEQQVGHINGDLRLARRPGGALLQPVDAARGARRPVPGRRRHARDPLPRRHEPGGQGVRRRPRRPRRRARAVGVRRRGRRAQAGLPGQPARHRRA